MTKLIVFSALTIAFIFFVKNEESGLANSGINGKYVQDSVIYLQKSIEFIKKVKSGNLSDTSNFVLVDQPPVYIFNNCLKNAFADTTIFSKQELAYLEQKKYPKLGGWKDEYFPNTKIIGRYTLDKIFKLGPQAGWEFFEKHVGMEGYHRFSYPIFLRNYTYCLFYTEHGCKGIFCGDGQMMLYKLEDGKWVYAKVYCDWSA